MTVHVHRLAGCAPAPLAHYLKALAILRLVSEQRDPTARGWWKGESFWLATTLSREELLHFFLNEYRPTPILSPWNGGSGFHYPDDPGLTPLERSTAARFAEFRSGIAAARTLADPLARAIQEKNAADDLAKQLKTAETKEAARVAEAKKKALKSALLVTCRRHWQGGLLRWFDAALSLDGDGEAAWPALLGSGGNDGRLDFTNNSMQHLGVLFDCTDIAGKPSAIAPRLLLAALFADPAAGLLKWASGQFLPGAAGGGNMAAGFTGESLVNPWDFVLTLEGAVLLGTSTVRSADAAGLPQAAAPFALRSAGVGYGSAARADEGPRGEQWMPMWTGPASIAEVRGLFSEGRARVGKKTAVSSLETAQAVARLGVARGVHEFTRYGYIERNGQANLAVPLGRWTTRAQPHQHLLDDLEQWVGRLRSFARDEHAPASVVSACRAVDEATLSACGKGGEYQRWQELLIEVGRAEAAIQASSSSAKDLHLGPIPPLRSAWVAAANDGSPEFRLAIALASQDAELRYRGATVFTNVRAHWLPIDRATGTRHHHAERRAKFATDAAGLARGPDVVCHGAVLEQDCIALVRRRIQLAPGLASRGFGLVSRWGAPLADINAFLAGAVDDRRILDLARPLMALEWWNRDALSMPRRPPSDLVDAAYAVVRLAHLSGPLDRGGAVNIRLDPEPISRLVAGDLPQAIALCLRRLRASGLSPVIRLAAGDARYARRIAASLAFPLSHADLGWCADFVTKPFAMKDSEHAD